MRIQGLGIDVSDRIYRLYTTRYGMELRNRPHHIELQATPIQEKNLKNNRGA
jgi:hypothetical protein